MPFAPDAENAKADFNAALITFGQISITVGLIPILLILGIAKADPVNLLKFAVYGGLALFGIGGILVLKFLQQRSFNGRGQDADIGAFGVLNHDPESGLIGAFAPKVARMLFGSQQILAYSTILFIGLLIVASHSPAQTATQSFIGQVSIPTIDFPTDDFTKVMLQVFPAAEAETIFIVAVSCFLASFIAYPFRNMSRVAHILIFLLALVVLITVFGVILHQAVYGANDYAIKTVLRFWLFGAIITAVTGSMIPFRIMHILNNFIVGASLFLSSDVTLAIMYVVLAVFGIALLATIIGRVITSRSEGASA